MHYATALGRILGVDKNGWICLHETYETHLYIITGALKNKNRTPHFVRNHFRDPGRGGIYTEAK